MNSTVIADRPKDLHISEVGPAAVSGRAGRRIPVAIIGAGYIAGYHLEVLHQLGSVEIVGACDPDATRLHSLCEKWCIPASAPALKDLLHQCRPEVVHVLVPPPFHYGVAKEALAAGLHVLVE